MGSFLECLGYFDVVANEENITTIKNEIDKLPRFEDSPFPFFCKEIFHISPVYTDILRVDFTFGIKAYTYEIEEEWLGSYKDFLEKIPFIDSVIEVNGTDDRAFFKVEKNNDGIDFVYYRNNLF